MSERSKRNRRVPPRGNPDEGEQQQFTTASPQTATIPWTTLIITTGLTTITGYVFLETIRGVHRYFKGRREEKLAALNPHPPEQPPGSLPNGSFQLPVPDGTRVPDLSGTGHGGFATIQRAPLTDVSTPLGQVRHEVRQYQTHVDSRFDRIERLLNAAHYGETG